MDGSPVDSNWVEGYGVCMGEGDFSVIYAGDHVEKFTVYTDTVGQFTGLTDKNGKKIFEGDIVDAKEEWWFASGPAGHDTPILVVEWDDEFCGFAPFADYDCDCGVYINASGCEVIGNIYDNPELLKVCDLV
jgi:uncharacterized phage protein (TIGR01671 family)